jgi:hypothetical protein
MVSNIWKNLIEIKRSKKLKMIFKKLVRLSLFTKCVASDKGSQKL